MHKISDFYEIFLPAYPCEKNKKWYNESRKNLEKLGVIKVAGKLKNCPRCGKLFMDMGRKICNDCADKEQEDEERAAEYVRDHRDATIKEIAEATGVGEKHIVRMVKEGKFLSSNGPAIEYPCDRCGRPITSGRFCSSCTKSVISEVKQVQISNARIAQIRDHEKANNTPGHGIHSKEII